MVLIKTDSFNCIKFLSFVCASRLRVERGGKWRVRNRAIAEWSTGTTSVEARQPHFGYAQWPLGGLAGALHKRMQRFFKRGYCRRLQAGKNRSMKCSPSDLAGEPNTSGGGCDSGVNARTEL